MDGIRAAFEGWMLTQGKTRGDLVKVDGEYRFTSVGERWEIWQAAWKCCLSMPESQAELAEEMEKIFKSPGGA